VGRRKTTYDIWLLQAVDTAGVKLNLVSLAALTTEKLHVLHVIGIQNTSIFECGNMVVIVTRKYIVIKVETDMYKFRNDYIVIIQQRII
jgi:hypothetical protein